MIKTGMICVVMTGHVDLSEIIVTVTLPLSVMAITAVTVYDSLSLILIFSHSFLVSMYCVRDAMVSSSLHLAEGTGSL